jgi:hypothetical protein
VTGKEAQRKKLPSGAKSQACRELDRLQLLLTDAIPALVRNFERIAELTQAQSRLLENALDLGTQANASEAVADQSVAEESDANGVQIKLKLARTYDAHIQHHLQSVLVALQFEDMATQLIAHLRERMDRLERKADGASKPDPKDDPFARTYGPISAEALKPGSVDLF